MERKLEIALENIKMLEVIIFESERERENLEERRKRELDLTWTAMATMKEEIFESKEKIEGLEAKVERLEAKDRTEKEGIWQELESWNREWEKSKCEEAEKEESEKIARFDERRDEEARKAKLNNLEMKVKEVWAVMKKHEEEVGKIKWEARKAIWELKREIDLTKREIMEKEEGWDNELRSKEAVRVGKGLIELLSDKLTIEKKREGKSTEGKEKRRLAIEWPEKEDEDEE